jgi:hypothetical protein
MLALADGLGLYELFVFLPLPLGEIPAYFIGFDLRRGRFEPILEGFGDVNHLAGGLNPIDVLDLGHHMAVRYQVPFLNVDGQNAPLQRHGHMVDVGQARTRPFLHIGHNTSFGYRCRTNVNFLGQLAHHSLGDN